MVAEFCERVIVMYTGRIVEEAPVRDLFANPAHPYTRGLLKSLPSIAGHGTSKRLPTISGMVPPLTRVGRVTSQEGTIVLLIETAEGPEHVVINLAPGTPRRVTLADGRTLLTDGLAARATSGGLVLAGHAGEDATVVRTEERCAMSRGGLVCPTWVPWAACAEGGGFRSPRSGYRCSCNARRSDSSASPSRVV